ncbi:UDP-N-acetylglucosamine 2-epimerase [Lysinibacillus sp. 1P01SD]|uniref:UDP-N-acetylglucosamine 2-epimerase n=1 Tax=Lysinibacillus sp. 1P01SD TaxID=3132285 RepID=UPI0039A3B52D
MKKILFLTGTRADYGKLKTLMLKVQEHENYELYLFVTGMHLMPLYGSTWREIEKDGFKNVYHFANQFTETSTDQALGNIIKGLSEYILEIRPNLIVVHGDRIEALGGAIVGALNNVLVAHIEGGEVSGTIDESIRHAITKFAHFHLVSNQEAKERILQLGESEENIHIIGSPDIDIMKSKQLPSLCEVKERYEINFDKYAIAMYHPVTTDVENIKNKAKSFVDGLISSKRNYIVIYPNNDLGNKEIIKEYNRLEKLSNFLLFPSIRFEFFLTLLKNAEFIIGNSSSGIREAQVYNIMAIDVGTRQNGRYNESHKHIIHCDEIVDEMVESVNYVLGRKEATYNTQFGQGNSDELFLKVINDELFWKTSLQKSFIDRKVLKYT